MVRRPPYLVGSSQFGGKLPEEVGVDDSPLANLSAEAGELSKSLSRVTRSSRLVMGIA